MRTSNQTFRVIYFASPFVALLLLLCPPARAVPIEVYGTNSDTNYSSLINFDLRAVSPLNARLTEVLGLIETGKYDQALAEIKTVLATNANSAPAHEIHGVALAKKQRLDEAVASFRKAGELNPTISTPWTKIGDIYLAKGDLENAKASLQRAIAIDPTDYRAHQRLGIVYDREGNVSQSIEHLEKGIIGPPADYLGVKVDLALLYNRTGQLTNTVKLLEPLVRPDTPSPAAHLALGTAYLGLKRNKEAIASFSQMQKFDPDPERAKVAMAIAYRHAGDFAQSLQLLESAAISQSANAWLAHYQKAETLLALKRPMDAIQSFRKASTNNPNPTDPRNREAEILAAEKQYDGAIKAYEAIRADGIANYKTYDGLATLYQLSGKYDEANKVLNEACKKLPHGSVYLRLGLFYGFVQKYDQARDALLKASSLSPADPRIMKALSQVYVRLGDMTNAIAVAKNLVQTQPRVAAEHTYLGALLEANKEYSNAIAEYEAALKLDPKQAVTLNNLAMVQLKTGQLADALRTAKQAVALAPEDAAILDTHGWILFKNGSFTDAVQALEKAVAKADRNPAYHYHLAACYQKLQQLDKARLHCKKAIDSQEAFSERAEAIVLARTLQ